MAQAVHDPIDVDSDRAPFLAGRFRSLPSAAELAAYERAVPGAGERVLALAERSFEQAIGLAVAERERLDIANKREHLTLRLIQGMAVVLSAIAICIGALTMFLTQLWLGAALGIATPVAALTAAAFIVIKRKRDR